MRHWTRTRDLALPLGGEGSEIWELREDGKPIASFPLEVRLGKPFDVLRMKGQSSKHFRALASQVRQSVAELYAASAPHRQVTICPCCGADTANATTFGCIYEIEYRRCACCAHVFVAEQPAPEILDRMFAQSATYAQEYTSQDQVDQRLREIIAPKLDWVCSLYRRHYGRELTSVVDVGAGGGHFVAGCRQAGLRTEGYEISKTAVGFAKRAFGVELKQENFLDAGFETGHFDAVTFWGLLEYTPEPGRFIAAARRRLSTDSGILVVEVPRADALATAIQSRHPAMVWRHLSPESHVNIYSDASIATLLYMNRFSPIAAWYFGMDFYELLCQFAVTLDDDRMMTRMGSLVAPMQAWLDAAEFVDDLILAAVPV
jgi:2-polyprenyl-3-methyl-5-hydroxy-6-metoxy-1,4-benzoquinol methylase